MSVDTATIDSYSIHRANNTFLDDWGGLGAPDVRQVRSPLPRRHGAVDSTSLYGPRVMPLRGWCGQVPGSATDAAAAVAAFDALKARLTPETSHVAVIRRHGRSADERMTVRVAGDVGIVEVSPGGTLIRWGVELVAPDPRLYEDPEVTAQRTGAGAFTATVAGGTVKTPPIIEVVGPTNLGTLTITNTTTAEDVVLTNVQALAAAAVMTVDMNARTVFHHLAYHPENVVPASTNWWALGLGANTITVAGTALQASTVVRARWRPARI